MKLKLLKGATALVLVIAVLLSLFVGTGVSVSAAEIDDSTVSASNMSITINRGDSYGYQYLFGSYAYVYSTSSGNKAFCLQPSKSCPTGNDSAKTFSGKSITETKNENLLKAFYYGYGGPAFEVTYDRFKNSSSASTVKGYMAYMKSQYNLNGCTGNTYYYAMTHMVAAYMYDGNKNYSSWPTGWQNAIQNIADKVKGLPSVSGKMKAYLIDTGSSTQKMAVPVFKIKLKLKKNSSVPSFTDNNSAYSLNDTRYVIYTDKAKATAAAKEKEGTAARYKDSIASYIATNANGEGWYNAKNKGATVDSNKTYYAIEWRSPKGYELSNTVYTFKDSGTVDSDGIPIFSFTATDTPKLSLKLTKKSSDTTIINGNSCYSLKGAEYTIYTDSKCTKPFNDGAKIVTDENGNGTYSNGSLITAQELWAKETKASPGYLLDKTVHKFTYSGTADSNGYPIYSFTSIEEPDSDPVTVLLQKYDATTGKGTNQEKLANAEYRINFYGAQYSSVSEIGTTAPTRSWVFKTNANGFLNYSAAYKISGDDFYFQTVDGISKPIIPYGTITVQEITAPPGYQINPEVFLANIDGSGDKLSWRTTNENIDNSVLMFPETEDNGGLEIRKSSDDNKVSGLWFRVSAAGYSKDFCTDSSGLIINDELSSLPIDKTYTVEELGLKGADGNYYYPKRYGTKPAAQTVTLQSGKTTTVSFRNTVIPAELQVIKTSDDDKNDYVYFSLKSSDGTEYPNFVTDSNGRAKVTNLPIYDDNDNVIQYTVEELGLSNGDGTYSIPDRYQPPEAQTFNLVDSVTNSNGTVVKSVMFHNTFRKGQLTIAKLYTSLDLKNVSVNHLWFNVSSSAGYNKDVEITYMGSWKVVLNDLDVYDSTGEPIAYTVEELGFKNAESGEYEFPSWFYRTEPQTVYLSESKVVNQVYSKYIAFMNKLKAAQLHVVKKSTDEDISGISFKLTSDSGYSSIKVTDENGELLFSQLPILNPNGEYIAYTLEELGFEQPNGTYLIPNKYTTPEAQTFTLADCDTDEVLSYIDTMGVYSDLSVYKSFEVEFENVPKYGALEIIKKSDDGITSNLFFNVKDSKGNDYGNQQTGSTGLTTYTDLRVYDENNELITYTVTELGFQQSDGSFKLPEQYKTPSVVQTTLSYDETQEIITRVTVTNKVYPGNLKIIKTADDNNVSGLYFRVTNENTKAVIGNYATTSDGTIYIENLPVCVDGVVYKYKIEELGYRTGTNSYTFPDRYVQPSPKYVTLVANGTAEVSFHNSFELGFAGIKKVDDSGNNVPNCTFGLYSSNKKDKNGFLLGDNLIDTCVSDSNGNGVFSTAISTGRYYVQEIEPAPGYSRNTDVLSVYVNANNNSAAKAAIVRCINYPTKLIVFKMNPFGEYVEGAYLICEDSKGNRIDRWRTTKEPHTIYGLLIGETYTIIEDRNPSGYAKADPIFITIQDDFSAPDINEVEMIDEPTGTVELHKKNANGQSIRGSQWEIRNIYGEKLTATQTGQGAYFFSAQGNVTTFNTDSYGDLKVSELPIGDYLIVEVSPPNNYMPYGYEIPFTISADSVETLYYDFEVQDGKAVLNKTGSIGTYPFYYCGCVFLLASILTISIYCKKRKTRKEVTK